MIIPRACTQPLGGLMMEEHWEIPLIVEAPACNCTV